MFWSPYLEEMDVKKTADLNSSLLALLAMDKEELALSIIENDSCLKTAVRVIQQLGENKEESDFRRSVNKVFMGCLVDVCGSRSAALIWMKSRLCEASAATILTDVDYVVTKFTEMSEAYKEKLGRFLTERKLVSIRKLLAIVISKFFIIGNLYLDLIMDIALVFILVAVKGSYLQFEMFTTQLLLLLVVSIAFPHFKSALTTAHQTPLVVLRYTTWKMYTSGRPISQRQLFFIKSCVFMFYPFVPALLMHNTHEVEKQRIQMERRLLHHPKELKVLENEIKNQSIYLKETREAILVFKRNELFIELMIQLPIHLSMVLLSLTERPIQEGFQAVFKQSDKLKLGAVFLLVFSTMWSMKTAALTYVKIKTEEKPGLNSSAKALLGVRAMITLSIRVICFVAYFLPFLGLLDIMNHYRAEQTSMDFITYKSLLDLSSDFHYWNMNDNAFQSVKIKDLYRSDYSNCTIENEYSSHAKTRCDPNYPIPPHITAYTVFSLKTAYITLLVSIVCYGILLWLIKSIVSDNFKSSTTWAKSLHILESMNFPDTCGDWDLAPINQQECIKKWWNHLKEMMTLISLQLVTNMALLIPIILTGKFFNIKF